MRFSTTLATSLLASIALASPIAHAPTAEALEARGLIPLESTCEVGLPCITQYYIDLAWSAFFLAQAQVNFYVDQINEDIAQNKAAAKGTLSIAADAIAPTGPVVAALGSAAANLTIIVGQVQAGVGPLSASAAATLTASVNAAIALGVSEIYAAIATAQNNVAFVGTTGAFVAAPVNDAISNVVTVLNAIVALVGPCNPPKVSLPPRV